MTQGAPHIPVLLEEVIDALAISPGETHVDGTFGAGGYTRAMLKAGARVIAFDRDPDAIAAGQAAGEPGLTLVQDRFSTMAQHVAEPVDGVTLDIGVSSMQLDQAGRGFSFQADGPLDMRMEQMGETAADFLNSADEADIADVIYRYGDEPKSRRIARAIVAARPIERTAQLASIVRRAVGWRDGQKSDPATRAFQAIRIHINRELEELEDGLIAAERVLKPGGRLAVVTFHSLEDRIVKRFLRDRSGQRPAGSRHLPEVGASGPAATFEAVSKPVRPGEAELTRNPRARSATLRVARRTSAHFWPDQLRGAA
ncbi:MAG: 16S rRNA (cytosine(1402)-N(4))-methyltransferase RsmH [Alphaproteobacteria bacterium]|jgi:16S rRNA (cytosine1402-N4)-methyltransferase|nr:16S rRNA (cytosine(1402)-N(4))-methyltransferase RsmH [Alphaproteobacteria bacterium]